jgi:hypothetical protein
MFKIKNTYAVWGHNPITQHQHKDAVWGHNPIT